VNFTREPTIETVITSKEGYKLNLTPINQATENDEFLVSAVELIAFGNCFFLRSLEKPKEFMLPANEYKISEQKEIRPTVKKPKVEKQIKIAGGKKTTEKKATQPPKKEPSSAQKNKKEDPEKTTTKEVLKENNGRQEIPVISDDILKQRKSLLPPPTTLISEQIDRYKSIVDDFATEKQADPVIDETENKGKKTDES
tara:strand:+ start:197 stop:790 length:594 start_codon:yes stop_codon:yes gene_type:complete